MRRRQPDAHFDLDNPFARYRWTPRCNVFEGLCHQFVIASVLYYRHDFSAWPDARYDNAAITLYAKYDETPAWFRERVTRGDLAAGTGFTIEPTYNEILICHAFLNGVYDANTCF